MYVVQLTVCMYNIIMIPDTVYFIANLFIVQWNLFITVTLGPEISGCNREVAVL